MIFCDGFCWLALDALSNLQLAHLYQRWTHPEQQPNNLHSIPRFRLHCAHVLRFSVSHSNIYMDVCSVHRLRFYCPNTLSPSSSRQMHSCLIPRLKRSTLSKSHRRCTIDLFTIHSFFALFSRLCSTHERYTMISQGFAHTTKLQL